MVPARRGHDPVVLDTVRARRGRDARERGDPAARAHRELRGRTLIAEVAHGRGRAGQAAHCRRAPGQRVAPGRRGVGRGRRARRGLRRARGRVPDVRESGHERGGRGGDHQQRGDQLPGQELARSGRGHLRRHPDAAQRGDQFDHDAGRELGPGQPHDHRERVQQGLLGDRLAEGGGAGHVVRQRPADVPDQGQRDPAEQRDEHHEGAEAAQHVTERPAVFDPLWLGGPDLATPAGGRRRRRCARPASHGESSCFPTWFLPVLRCLTACVFVFLPAGGCALASAAVPIPDLPVRAVRPDQPVRPDQSPASAYAVAVAFAVNEPPGGS